MLQPMANPFAQRRDRLRTALQSPLSLFSGPERSRNYRANHYPYRASSHFLYFAGVSIPSAILDIAPDGNDTLWIPKPADDDALWHGETESLESIEAAVGCNVGFLSTGHRAHQSIRLPHADGLAEQSSYQANFSVDDAALDQVINLRLHHDVHAISELSRAAEISGVAHRRAMQDSFGAYSEAYIAASVGDLFAKMGGTSAYESIVTIKGDVLHCRSYQNRLSDGDLLLVDAGFEAPSGFASDVTRTWPVRGRFTSTQKDIYEVVLAAQQSALAVLRPGAEYRDVHLSACRTIAEGLVSLGILVGEPTSLVERGTHALFFPHGIGHLLGLDVHDMEDLGDRAGYAPGRNRSQQFGLSYLRLDRTLSADMAVTIEPGIYFSKAVFAKLGPMHQGAVNWDRVAAFADVRGIRIEDDVLLTTDAHKVLSHNVPKTVSEVEALVQSSEVDAMAKGFAAPFVTNR